MASAVVFPSKRPEKSRSFTGGQRLKEVPLAAGGIRREHYDSLGRLVLQEDPDNSWLRYAYSPEGEISALEHSSGERVDYEFDRARREWRARNALSETLVRLSVDGYPSEVRLRIQGHEFVVRYVRDLEGKVLSCEYPGGTRLEAGVEDDLGLRRVRAGSINYCTIRSKNEPGESMIEFSNGVTAEECIEDGRLSRIAVQDATGREFTRIEYDYDEHGRISQTAATAGHRVYRYDECGRLLEVMADSAVASRGYEYDPSGRLCANGTSALLYGNGPMVAGIDFTSGRVTFEHDALGRRTERLGPEGTTRYRYNLFGQVQQAELPDGKAIEYIYDGFGRLIGRRTPSETRFYIPGIDGNRLAEVDQTGRIVWSYLWWGGQCIGRIAGPLGAPLESSFHRAHGARLIAVGDSSGRLRSTPGDDPFGADTAARTDCPGYASLFGDADTGLLFAGHRWLDCSAAQFLTPDSWFASEPAKGLSAQLKMVLDRLPGGSSRSLDPVTAFAWCAYDPVNHTDANGHNWLGLIFSIFSSLLWESQLNGLALELEAINIIVDILQLIIFREAWDTDGYWLTSVFHLAPPVASYRLMVPLGLILNGISTRDGRAWTLGNVIFSRTKDLTDIEDAAKRDLLLCNNATDYVAFANEAAANRFLGRNPLTVVAGTISTIGTASPAAGATIAVTAITTPAGATLAQVLAASDFISIGVTGESSDEIRQISSITAPNITLNVPPLPASLTGKTVNIARLDRSILKIEKDTSIIARAVQFIRGKAIHYGTQIPDGFPTSGLTVTEFLKAGIKKDVNGVSFPAENLIIRMNQAADLTGYSTGDFIRVLATGAYAARLVTAVHPPTDLELDSSLPATASVGTVQVVKLNTSGSAVASQNVPSDGTGVQQTDRITVGTLTDLQKLDGLAISDAASNIQRRIAIQLFLDCTVDALPVALQNVAMQIETMGVDTTVQATAKMQGATGTQIQLDAGQTATFAAGQGISVKRLSDGLEVFGVLAPATAAGLLALVDALSTTDFADTTAVTVTLLSPSATAADAASGSPANVHVVATVTVLTQFALNDVVRVRLPAPTDPGVIRKLATAPGVQAQLDSALPNTHFANVSVQRFVPDSSTQHDNATAPSLQERLVISGTNPYVVGDQVYITGTEQAWGQVERVDGGNVFLTAPVTQAMGGTVNVSAIGPSGVTTPDGKLDEGLVLIPSDPGADPLTRRGAVENHEMRHVWQGAVWGPFLLSLPIPWLINVGFSFTKFRNTTSKIFRYASLGGLDSLVAGLVWLIGSRKSGTTLSGTLNADRKTVQIASEASADDIQKFDSGSQVEVTQNDVADFNLVDSLDAGSKTIKLRFEVGDANNAGGAVTCSISPFEKIRRKVSQICSVNLETIWHDHIPTAWGRALSAVAQRDSWLPPFGVYPMSLLAAGGDQNRLPNEQDAAYHSGDLYTDISTSDPNTIFVGQFSKLFAFIQARYGGLSSRNAVNILQVALPTGVQPADVPGAVGTGPITFRENYFIQLSDQIENAVGVFFVTSKPGVYTVMPPDNLLNTNGVVFKFAFDVDFANLSKLTVNDIAVTPDPTGLFFETQDITFIIVGDATALYALRFPLGSAGNIGTISGLKYTAPVLLAASAVTQAVEIAATYSADHPVFSGSGQSALVKLTPDQRTNLCKQLTLSINPLTSPTIPDVTAGSTVDFTMPIAPNGNPTVTSALPAGAAVNARVTVLGGSPAQLRFFAPDNVTAATPVTFDMVFGADPANRKTVTATVNVNPHP